MNDLKIIYLAGCGHSGATLLGRLLDRHPKIASIGSMGGVGAALDHQKEICSCGANAMDCPLWAVPLERARRAGITKAGLLQPTEDRAWQTANAEMLSFIKEATGSEYICEATHHKHRPWLYAKAAFADVFVVHLVRDPRGVLFSYQRKNRPLPGRIASLYKTSLFHEMNRLRFMNEPAVHYLQISYEQLCAAPIETLNRIARFAGLSQPFETSLLEGDQPHLLGGNRMKRLPLTKIEHQTKFITETTRGWWWTTTASTFPLLRRYGYPLFPPRPRATSPFCHESALRESGS